MRGGETIDAHRVVLGGVGGIVSDANLKTQLIGERLKVLLENVDP